MLSKFHRNCVLPKGTNATFVVLIPKIDNPHGLKEHHPITLVGCLYKIIAKVLSNRLRRVLHKVVDESQSAFLSGQNMLDNVVVANEMIQDAKKRLSPCVIFVVDFDKAYNSLR